jgi:hypothetical protein
VSVQADSSSRRTVNSLPLLYFATGLEGLGILWLPHYMSEPHVAARRD